MNYLIQILVFYFAFDFSFNPSPYIIDYQITIYINGETYPQNAPTISLENLAELDSISITDGKEIINEIPDWEIIVVGKYEGSAILSEFNNNVVSPSFAKKLAKLDHPKQVFIDVKKYRASRLTHKFRYAQDLYLSASVSFQKYSLRYGVTPFFVPNRN
jgi:hypothetical protein